MGFTDPYIANTTEVTQDTPDDLNVNANMQVNDTDVSSSNPVPSDEIEPANYEGAPVTVGTTAVELTFSGTTSSVMVQSDPDNSGNVWIGKSNITNAGANAMSQLLPGQAVAIELNDASAALYAVSDTAAQTVYKLATL